MRRLITGVLIASVLAPSAALAAAPPGTIHLPTAERPSARGTRVAEQPARPPRQIATVVIPRLRLRAPMYMGSSDAIFDVGLGQWPGTPKPGQKGNVVIGGHRTGGRMPFINIDKMRKGDVIKVIVGKKTWVYKVTSKKIVKPNNMTILKQTTNATLTLYTCHPPHSIKMRYIVRAALSK